jgi:hypothetical protein
VRADVRQSLAIGTQSVPYVNKKAHARRRSGIVVGSKSISAVGGLNAIPLKLMTEW